LNLYISLNDEKGLKYIIEKNITIAKERIIITYKKSFYMWFCQIINSISQKQNEYILHLIYSLHYRGLSFTGIELLHQYGCSPSVSTVQRFVNRLFDRVKLLQQDYINSGKTILWIDNYSKFFKQSNLTNGGWKSCKWTAMGFIYCNDIDFKRKSNLFIIPTKPMFNIKYSYFRKKLRKLRHDQILINDDVYIKNNNIYTVPLSVLPQDRIKNQVNYQYNTFKIDSRDIANNIALNSIMKEYYSKFFKKENYNLILCDSNIYWRLCKKYYSKPKPNSSRPTPILGWWHPGKMLVEIVWRQYLSFFIGPIYHSLFPNNNILFKVRLSHSLEFFLNLYSAYESFKSDGNEIVIGNEKKHLKYRSLLKNIKLLFNFFLPLVSNIL
jgi:hypothetical protein